MERLDKFLCDSGVGTRSQVKVILKTGEVTVDGLVIRDGAMKIAPEKQTVCFRGEMLSGKTRVVLMLNKPAGYVTATEDKQEKTVMEWIPDIYKNQGVKPVGRLDKATEGLLLFTNDGELLHCLISPKKQVPKRYYARHEGTATDADVEAFAQGITLGNGEVCMGAVLEIIGPGESMVEICEGKYHQVRRMMASRGLTVTYLERRQEGNLVLGDLPRGEVRLLTEAEIRALDEIRQYPQK